MLQKLEHKWRRNLVRGVGNTYIEKRKWDFDCISSYQLELMRVTKILHALGYLGNHPCIDFNSDYLLASFKQGRC